jgi:hypothetical protein
MQMRYMMLVCCDPEIEMTPAAQTAMRGEMEVWLSDVNGRGVRGLGSVLAPIIDATTVRVRAGEVVIADGPFAETKEFIAGFDILDCADLDEAMEIAGKHPMARFGAIELRPFREG